MWYLVAYLFVKLAALGASSAADFATLRKCDSWLTLPDHDQNPQLTELAEAGVCPWARLAYGLGSCLVFAPLGSLATAWP